MPAELERVVRGIKREHPGMPKGRAWAIGTNTFKRSHGLRGKTTEGEMMRAAQEKTAGPIANWMIKEMKETLRTKKGRTMNKEAQPGFGGGPYAAGPGGTCVCTSCGHEEKHEAGQSCRSKKCPKCGASMARKGFEKVSAFEEGFFDELEKIGATYAAQPSFAARHPGWTTAGGAGLGWLAGGVPGTVGWLAGMKPEHAMILDVLGRAGGAIGGGYLGYRHAKKRQRQFAQGSPEAISFRKVTPKKPQ